MRKTFKAELASLHPIFDWIRHHLEETTLSEVEVRRIEVALEEGIVNIMSYAYQGEEGDIEVAFNYHPKEFVEITFKDRGLPFNPLKHEKEIDPLVPIEELKEGGWGIVFMKKIMDHIEYKRENETNILTLRKDLSKKPH